LRRLDWDTEFFGLPFALVSGVEPSPLAGDRTAAYLQLLDELSTAAACQGFAHLTYRPPPNDWSAVHALEGAGWLLVDLGVDYRGEALNPQWFAESGLRRSRGEDLPALRELAGTAFVYSRFGVDPFFSDAQVRAFHEQWVTNLHNGLARSVLVSESAGQLSGFVACSPSEGSGRIPLIAVAAELRGQGLGGRLVQGALGWFADLGVREVRVKTQANNIPAVGLYERCGFVLEKTELTFTRDLRTRPGQKGLQQ
jgi:dTDP-4-amino-4,6-dideoxy-D-galactose acyltransferase